MKKHWLFIALLVTSIISSAQTVEEGLKALDFERYEYARNVFTKLIAQDPSKGDNYYYLGQTYGYLLQPDSSLMEYNAGIKAEPSNGINYVGLGEYYLNENKVNDAKAQFEKALSFSKDKDGKPNDAKILSLVAGAMVSGESKLLDDALTTINRSLEIDKKNYDIMIIAGDVMLERNEGGPAASFYEKAIDLNKARPKAYTRLAGVWLRVRNAEATFTELNRALAIDPNYAPALKSLAEYYYQTRKFEKAKETYKKYLENSEASVANKVRFAQILFRTKEYEEALNEIIEIQKTDRNNIYLFRLAGYSYYEVGEAKKDTSKFRPGLASMETFFTKVDLQKVIQSDYEYYGKLLSKIPGKDSLAIMNIRKAIDMDSSKVELYRDLAMVYNKSKKFNEATDYFELYISRAKKPNAADYYLMGRAAYFAKQYDKADSAFMKVSELKPDYADAYLWRGNSNVQLDPDAKTTIAKEFYERYVTLAEAAPDKNKRGLVDAYDYLGKYAIKKDDSANAKAYFNKIVALDPENKEAKEILKQLK
jgi:tetratricopeptide (TPR) repeat protein